MDWDKIEHATVLRFKSGEKPLASWIGYVYTVHIMQYASTNNLGPKGIYVHQRTCGGMIHAHGGFVDYWDEDILIQGYTEKKYKTLSLKKRAEINAKIQSERYENQFAYVTKKHRYFGLTQFEFHELEYIKYLKKEGLWREEMLTKPEVSIQQFMCLRED